MRKELVVKKWPKKEPNTRYNKPKAEDAKTWTVSRMNCLWTKNVDEIS
jgi:hypothetical protein